MRLIFDQNLSRKLVSRLCDLFPGSSPVPSAGQPTESHLATVGELHDGPSGGGVSWPVKFAPWLLPVDVVVSPKVVVVVFATGPVRTSCTVNERPVDCVNGDTTEPTVTFPDSLSCVIDCDSSVYPNVLPDGPVDVLPAIGAEKVSRTK